MTKRDIPQSVFDSAEARRVVKAGHKQACDELARLHPSKLDAGNPNHPVHSGLFGYDTQEFMDRQMRRSHDHV